MALGTVALTATNTIELSIEWIDITVAYIVSARVIIITIMITAVMRKEE